MRINNKPNGFQPVTLFVTLEGEEEIKAIKAAKTYLAMHEIRCDEMTDDQKQFIVHLLEGLGKLL